ncbi:methionyl-tRNA formyltransferase [Tistlia consotensis]|uniref:Methionyl-tRNA formyltransferase n=1 Tax=Tistlia consotensis USBA 355 TaxID=560819 RepID=A0A1Y6BFT0_9PROT|nr:methionyl-tRNA formyltransferase [Tistlia consotensis]SMF07704.1 methionyl-tRNA formyltransferase [Tistlia consotensis USBA 355]SNR35740.1 methionyl-tRNA formyltransferase [Tistlia consotensis]
MTPAPPKARQRLRLAFLGAPDFAVATLAALLDAGHEVACVYSQPPRPAGRGQKPRPAPVQAFAEARGLPVRTPASLRDPAEQAAFAALALDAAVVVAFGQILPRPILEAPRLGCVNVHASLLPRWRGAAPIQRAILAGDAESGVTIMLMDAGLDTGPMLLREALPLAPDETGRTLHDKLAALGARLIVPALDGLADGSLPALPQPDAGASYATKLSREEARLDWTRPAWRLERQVRAFTPWPGAFFEHEGTRLKVLAAETVAEAAGEPGLVLDGRLTIACGEGALRPSLVQRPGKAAMATEALLRGYPIAAGTRLPCPATS